MSTQGNAVSGKRTQKSKGTPTMNLREQANPKETEKKWQERWEETNTEDHRKQRSVFQEREKERSSRPNDAKRPSCDFQVKLVRKKDWEEGHVNM